MSSSLLHGAASLLLQWEMLSGACAGSESGLEGCRFQISTPVVLGSSEKFSVGQLSNQASHPLCAPMCSSVKWRCLAQVLPLLQGCWDPPIQYLVQLMFTECPLGLWRSKYKPNVMGPPHRSLWENQGQGPNSAMERVVCRPLPICDLCVTGLQRDMYRHRELLRNSLTLQRHFIL